jgi:hypothetical protein
LIFKADHMFIYTQCAGTIHSLCILTNETWLRRGG